LKEPKAKPVKVTEEDIGRFLEDEKISSDYYGYILGKFHRSGGELSEETVQGFLNENYEKKSSRNTALSVLRSLAEWKKGKIPPLGEDNQLKRWTLDRVVEMTGETTVTEIEKRGLTLKELEGKLTKCKDTLQFAIIWLLHWFGCRPGELVMVEPDAVNFEEGSVKFETEKTKVERECFFDEFTGEQLEEFVGSGFGYQFVYRRCKDLGMVPKSGRRSFRTNQPGKIDWTPPVRVHELIDLWCGHTVTGMDFVYSNVRPHLKRIREVHYMKPLEEAM